MSLSYAPPHTNILLIEDTPSDAALIRAYLEDDSVGEPFHVIHATTMDAAIKTMATTKIQAVVLDLLLPDTEDLSGLSSVRAFLPSAPVLILTGRDDESLAFRAVETGAQDYLLKDKINPPMLRRSINYAMQRKRYEDRITFQANFDSLTLLPNRQHFKERLEVALMRQQRSHNALAVMMMDLNGFKSVNDKFGHETGDRLLHEIGQRLPMCLRPYDLAARFGGDEFLVLIEDISKTEDAESVARKVIDTIQRPLVQPTCEIKVGASIGIALSRSDENLSVDILLRRADQAMYLAKKRRQSGYSFYDGLLADEAAIL